MQNPDTTSSNDNNRRLWLSLKEGNHSSLEKLYMEYSNKLYNYGAKFSTDKELIKDCIQDLFITLWDRRQHLGSPANIKNYLFKSFRLSVFKKAAFLKNRESYEDAENYPFYATLGMEDYIIADEEKEQIKSRLQTTLNQLTARQREAIFLKFYEGLTYDEIAEIMGISVKGTYKLVARGIDLLRAKLNKSDLLLLFLLLQLKLYN